MSYQAAAKLQNIFRNILTSIVYLMIKSGWKKVSLSIFLSLWGVLDFNQEYKLRAPWGVFVVFASLLGKWWCSFLSFTNCQAAIYSGLVNWGALLSSLISWEVCVLNLFPAHTWIPGRMSLFLSPVTW